MATKTITTRIKNKYDTYENWTTNNPVLLAGEVAVATVANNAGDVHNAPSILIKVGDGTTAYNDLEFVSGLAADVYAWAKAASKPTYAATEISGLETYVKSKVQDTDTQYRITKVDDNTYKLQSKAKGAADTTFADVSTISIPTAAATLKTARTIDGVSFNGSANISHYAECSTAAATAAKTVTLTGFTLAVGARITVKFTVTNTAASPTLNVNNTGAKPIFYRGAAIAASNLTAKRVHEFVYDGTNYELVGDLDNNTTYAVATTTKNGLMSADDKTKLDGIEAGAQANTITGVKGDSETTYRTGNVNITKANVGLGNVTNESKATMFTNPAFTGKPTAPTAATSSNDTQVATTAFVQSIVNSKIAAADAMIYKGTLGTSGTVTALPATHSTGWTYKVITAGTYAGVKCEVGDMVVCLTDGTAAKDSDWTVIQANIDGAVTGPASAVANRVAVFDGTTGKVIKDSGFTIGTSVPSGAKFTDTTYSAATTSANGLMTAADKTKLDGIATGANKTVVDTALSTSSTNPVQNKVVATKFNSLAAIATSGNVNDLVQTDGDVLIFDCGNSVV